MAVGALLFFMAEVHARQADTATVSTGAGLVSAVEAGLVSATNNLGLQFLTSVVVPNVTLGNANFSIPGNLGGARYYLTFTGSLPDPSALPLLDTSRRSGLVQPQGAQQSVTLTRLQLLNLCGDVLTWDSTVYMLTSNVYLFGGNKNVTGKRRFQDSVMYVPEAELYQLMYLAMIQGSTFHTVISSMPQYFVPPINFQAQVANMSRFAMTVLSDQRPSSSSFNVTLRATSDPQLPGNVRALLQPPALCNGSVLHRTSPLLALDSKKFPLNVAYDSDSLQYSLTEAGIYTQNKVNTDPIPALFLTSSLVLGGESGQYAPVTLRAECMLHGPVIQGTDAYVHRTVTLSMGKQANILQLAVRGRLLISHLVLSSLILQPLSTQAIDSSASAYSTALPLWSINMVSRSSPQVYMDQVTMTLPQSDYAALLSAALRGSAWQSGARSTRPLMQGINTFQLAAGFNPASTSPVLLLSAYEGWGISATNLAMVPNMPLATTYILPDQEAATMQPPPPSSAGTATPPGNSNSGDSSLFSSSSSSVVAIGVGVGMAVLAGVAATVVVVQRRKQQAATEAARAEEERRLQAEKTASLALSRASHLSCGQGPGSNQGGSGVVSSWGVGNMGNNSAATLGPSGKSAALQLNVVALHAAVKARQSVHADAANNNGTGQGVKVASSTANVRGGVDTLPTSSTQGGGSSSMASTNPSNTMYPDPKKAVLNAVSALGNMDADKLTLLGVLGRGTWGTVYKGLWRNLDVAVKTVLFSSCTDGKGSLPHERAIMEAAVCTSVAHRNVVATYHYDIKPVMAVEEGNGLQVALSNQSLDLLTTEWKLYLVQEWCNTSMGAAMRAGLLHSQPAGPPLMDLLLSLLLDVASGIQYLHDKSIIHGDLKPENVMLKMDPASPIGVVAKITDFGLSTTLAPQATHVSNFSSGTPFYVAPEVVGEGRVTKASDIYSLGVIMWELFTCSSPWVRSPTGVYNLHPQFMHFPAHAPWAYTRLAKLCMQKDALVRPTMPSIITQLHSMHKAWLAGDDLLEGGAAAAPGAAQPAAVQAASATAANGTAPPPTVQQQQQPAPGAVAASSASVRLSSRLNLNDVTLQQQQQGGPSGAPIDEPLRNRLPFGSPAQRQGSALSSPLGTAAAAPTSLSQLGGGGGGGSRALAVPPPPAMALPPGAGGVAAGQHRRHRQADVAAVDHVAVMVGAAAAAEQ